MEDQKQLRENILATIQKGQAKMTPRWHFILKASLFLFGFILVFLLALYLLSFALFVLDKSQLWFVPEFGMHGIFIFFRSLPWFLIFIVLLLIIFVQILARHYSFSYQRPLLYSVLGIVMLIVFGSSIIQKFGLHEGVSEYSRLHKVPFAGMMYERFEFGEETSVYSGVIIEIRDPNFSIRSRRQEVLKVEVNEETRFPLGKKFVVGDDVLILGEREDDRIEAYGVRPIPRMRGGMMRSLPEVRED